MTQPPSAAGSALGEGQRYTHVAVALHWAIAALILLNIAVGLVMEGLPPTERIPFILFHISTGITILVLTVLRIVWRLTHRPPPLLPSRRWEAMTAKAVHVLLYSLMVYLPLTGWSLISANPPPGVVPNAPAGRGSPPSIWGVVKLPLIAPLQQMGSTLAGVPRQKKVHDDLVEAHALGAFTLIFLVALHILGALKHEFFDGGRELRRMSFSKRPRESSGDRAGQAGPARKDRGNS